MRTPTVALALIAAALALLFGTGCGTKSTSSTSQAKPETTQTTTSTPGESNCEAAGQDAVDYDVLAPGNSRKGYLTVLHTLQRDCPEVADKLGLASDFLPRCKRLDQESCTMYPKP